MKYTLTTPNVSEPHKPRERLALYKEDGTPIDLENLASGATTVVDHPTSGTLTLADANAIARYSGASSGTLTVPKHSDVPYPVGTLIRVTQYGTGVPTVAAASGVTLRTPNGSATTNVRYSSISLSQVAIDEWVVEAGAVTTSSGVGLPPRVYTAGRSYMNSPVNGNVAAVSIYGDCVATPFIVETAQRFDAIDTRPFLNGTGTLIRCGLYADNNEEPAALIVDAGTVDGSTGTPPLLAPIDVTLSPGLYWLATVLQSTPVSPVTTSATLAATTAITSIPVISLPVGLASGSLVWLPGPTATNWYAILSAAAAQGATAISVASITPTASIPSGTSLQVTAPASGGQLVGTRQYGGNTRGLWNRRPSDFGYVFPMRSAVWGALPNPFAANTQWHTGPRAGLRAGAPV